jgi:hypothetical protein
MIACSLSRNKCAVLEVYLDALLHPMGRHVVCVVLPLVLLCSLGIIGGNKEQSP